MKRVFLGFLNDTPKLVLSSAKYRQGMTLLYRSPKWRMPDQCHFMTTNEHSKRILAVPDNIPGTV